MEEKTLYSARLNCEARESIVPLDAPYDAWAEPVGRDHSRGRARKGGIEAAHPEEYHKGIPQM